MVHESSETFLSKPVGIVHSQLHEKHFLYIGLEDGCLIRQEVKIRSSTSEMIFGSKQTIEGNGNSIDRIMSQGDHLLLHHSSGLVSLWSNKGSEICQYDKKSNAVFMTNEPISSTTENDSKLILARTDIEIK